jgi:hypothetical protein
LLMSVASQNMRREAMAAISVRAVVMACLSVYAENTTPIRVFWSTPKSVIPCKKMRSP